MAEAGQAERGEARADGAGLVRGWLENSLCFCQVKVTADDGTDVALALVTYQL